MTKTRDELLELKAHNPVPENHDQEWANSPKGRAVFARVEAQMGHVQASGKKPRWRRPSFTIPAFVVLSATALAVASAGAGDKVVTVSASDALANPAAVERSLADEGIDAQIRAVPANHTLVGKWFHLYFAPNSAIDDEAFGLMKSYVGEIDGSNEAVMKRCPIGDCERTSLLEIPGTVKGPMTLVVGREPQPGEEYWAREIDWDNELAPSGALYCYRLEDKTPTEAGALLERLGYNVIWVHEDDKTSNEVPFPPTGDQIEYAFFRGPETVDMRTATPQNAERYKEAGGTPSQRHPRSSAPWAPQC
jgi:hypothetical protein